MKLGISGELAKRFVTSPLTPLFLITAIIAGFGSFTTIAREEDPQIPVPFVDVIVNADGLKAADAVELLTKPLETILQATPGVDHVYSTTVDNHLTVTARFVVGTSEDDAVLRVNDKIRANLDRIPIGIPEPLVVGHGIDDVAMLTLTLTPKPNAASRWDAAGLTDLAHKLQAELVKIPNIGLTYVAGDDPEQIRVEPDPEKLMLYGVTLQQLVARMKEANETFSAGIVRDDGSMRGIDVGQTLSGVPDIGLLLVTTRDNRPVYVEDVANITIGPAPVEHRVWAFTHAGGQWVQSPAVTLAIAKRGGANAVTVSKAVLRQVRMLRGSLIPDDIDVQVTRNYGQTAAQKSNQLLMHLLIATISIIILIGFAIGWREAGVTAVVIPTTIMLTLFAIEMMGFSLNRETFFGLIFSVGILADDAIVFIENISRHWNMNDGRTRVNAAVEAVAEVGNPTIIATMAVITALLPILFVPGIMGPFMAAVPASASAAMGFSFFVAVFIVPWLMIKFAKKPNKIMVRHSSGWLAALYLWAATPLLASRQRAVRFLWLVGIATIIIAVSVFYFELVKVKLLFFDDKPELDVVLNLPPGSSLEDTEQMLFTAARIAGRLPDVTSMQAYAGTPAPFNFTGLVRQYYARQSPELGELHIVLADTGLRLRHSHDVALALRSELDAGLLMPGLTVKVVESPAGPPLIATLVAEIYGPDQTMRRTEAEHIKAIFKSNPNIVDVDDSYGQPPPRLNITINQDELEYFGVQQSDVNTTLSELFDGVGIGYSYRGAEHPPLEIAVGLPKSNLAWDQSIATTPVPANVLPGGRGIVELGQVVDVTDALGSPAIFRRDGHFVDMVTAELSGNLEAPIYGMLAVDKAIDAANWGKLAKPDILFAGQPKNEAKPSLLWAGEWELTYSTFRDMIFAFGVALLGIYILVVGLFGSYKLPLVVLTPIPLTLIGIVIGHLVLHADFTTTSMLGLIALAGIIVRNSILLVDFINRLRGPDRPLRDVLLEAGAVRVKPIVLTALSAMISAVPIFPDPIFHGLAISLIFGLFSSTFLTLLVIPAIYIVLRDDCRPMTLSDYAGRSPYD